MNSAPMRRVSRAATVTAGLALGSVAAPAFAEPPTQGEQAVDPSALHFLLIFVGYPVLIIAILALLVYLPSMIKGQSTEPALAFHGKSEWLGGPRKTPELTGASGQRSAQGSGDASADQETGGASARW